MVYYELERKEVHRERKMSKVNCESKGSSKVYKEYE